MTFARRLILSLTITIVFGMNITTLLLIYPKIGFLRSPGNPEVAEHYSEHPYFNISCTGTGYVISKMCYLAYVGDSHPMWWNTPNVSVPVEMTFAETEAYPIEGSMADLLWTSNRSPRTHKGYIRLGPEQRLFAISMFHQLHCVNTFRRALVDPANPIADEYHVQHCLSYLRQFFLCGADDTLEPHDFLTRDYAFARVSHTRVCRDWSAVYRSAELNYQHWQTSQRNITSVSLSVCLVMMSYIANVKVHNFLDVESRER